MSRKPAILLTLEFIKEKLNGAEPGHDYWHSFRVWKNTLYILQAEKADEITCELAALLHDIADPKFHEGNEDKGPEMASTFLKSISISSNIIAEVQYIIRNISFAGGLKSLPQKTPELKVVQDADRLDAMGAIGIARAFSYGGYKKRLLYDPSIDPLTFGNIEEYRNSKSSTLNHFYEKLFLLKDLMNTDTGKKLAEERHETMEKFVQQFLKEWGN